MSMSALAAMVGMLAVAPGGGEGTFREKVAPILERRCVGCHSEAIAKGKLSLATAAGIHRGGEGGPAIEPGKPDESLLVEKIAGSRPAMPKNAPPLTPAEVETVRAWIEAGAGWPEGLALSDRKTDGGPWWSLRPLSRPEVPRPKTPGWSRTPIDAISLLRGRLWESKGLVCRAEDGPSAPSDPPRAPSTLTGPAADAGRGRGVRSPIKKPERLRSARSTACWPRPLTENGGARHWLDLAHYGDTHGYDKDKRRDHAWPYRDYVIDALNRDTPYDRFVREQLAGDVLFPGDPDGVVATGFIAAGPWDFVGHVELGEGTVEKAKTRLLDRDDMVTTAITTFASLTIHCARCHDHKFDPIPQRDYYRLQAVFAGVERGDRSYYDPASQRRHELAARESTLHRRRADLIRSIADAGLRDRVERLADRKGGSGPTNGYHSGIEPGPDATKWVQVDLGRSVPLEAIRLFPARPVDFAETPGFGFPARRKAGSRSATTRPSAPPGSSPTGPGPTPPIPGTRPSCCPWPTGRRRGTSG